ncbi:pro-Pol polyprotein [Trichonephila inaurata madagascariensis]|uniref:Pro-Pol polyprotein n=1 Tax=Trichonephila inaurata madagascariensis TaxID=2747483 RepID=A0A8X6YP90_9ARAC|nr:pro-Pol polyprotein [Trichonephila inaurata madagascariensis]
MSGTSIDNQIQQFGYKANSNEDGESNFDEASDGIKTEEKSDSIFTTKAVHIQAVGDLTTDSFVAALRRFSARRGATHHIYSDNGTNCIRKLNEIRKLWLSLPSNEAISYYLSKSSIHWHFIPPSSPHFWRTHNQDDILLIKEEGPPGTWPMARVLQVDPGNDGLVRVATVKTKDSVFKRPVHKLRKVPIYPN